MLSSKDAEEVATMAINDLVHVLTKDEFTTAEVEVTLTAHIKVAARKMKELGLEVNWTEIISTV